MFRSQGLRVFKRTKVLETGIKTPKGVNVINQASSVNPAPQSATLANGTKGTRLFPKGTMLSTFRKEIPSVMGWFVSFGSLMMLWPYLAFQTNRIMHHVPPQTPQVALEGGRAIVDSPIQASHLDQPSDDY